MELKAKLWLWMNNKRSYAVRIMRNKTGPALRQLYRDLPASLETRIPDPIHHFHSYLIERIIQCHLSGEYLCSGPTGISPDWMKCQATRDLKDRYPVCISSRRGIKNRMFGELYPTVCRMSACCQKMITMTHPHLLHRGNQSAVTEQEKLADCRNSSV